MLVLEAPAKVNLFLRILGRRRDGYHEVASLFQTIDLKDTLTLSLAKEDSLTCTDSTIGPNLATQAIDLFRSKTGLTHPLSVHLEKRIPLQAGLGGGSSDAAAALKGVNALLGSPVSIQELQLWSGEIGSDVPFFFSSGTAYCTGRGERVRDLFPYAFDQKLEIFKPPEGLSTPAVYQSLKLEECSLEDPEELLEGFLFGNPVFLNDLEKPAFRLLPVLAEHKKRLNGTMSGSGTAFYFLNSCS